VREIWGGWSEWEKDEDEDDEQEERGTSEGFEKGNAEQVDKEEMTNEVFLRINFWIASPSRPHSNVTLMSDDFLASHSRSFSIVQEMDIRIREVRGPSMRS
jgi:hypothetical protein